jgi:hypothetical protein
MTKEHLNKMEYRFWGVTQHILKDNAVFNDSLLAFDLKTEIASCPQGYYHLISKQKDRENITGQYLYRMSHPLGEYVLKKACSLTTPPAMITFNISGHPVHISVVEQLKGKSGWLVLTKFTIEVLKG